MMRLTRVQRLTSILGLAGMALFLFGCTLTRTVANVVLPAPSPVATAEPVDGAWQVVAPGVERRDVRLEVDGPRDVMAVVVRLDPATVRLEVHYSPGAPYSLDDWRLMLHPTVLVNGGFFDENNGALGLIVTAQGTFGQSFSGFGGMLQQDAAGLRVRSLVTEPYWGEPLLQAVQSFPMLIEKGGMLAPQGDGFDVPSRRTVVGQDRSGRILLLAVPLGLISLADLQVTLMNSDLDLDVALALDGGRSTGLIVEAGSHQEVYPALDQLPSVIAVFSP